MKTMRTNVGPTPLAVANEARGLAGPALQGVRVEPSHAPAVPNDQRGITSGIVCPSGVMR